MKLSGLEYLDNKRVLITGKTGSFLALMLMKELLSRLEDKGKSFEWDDIERDLQALREVEISMNGENYYLRT